MALDLGKEGSVTSPSQITEITTLVHTALGKSEKTLGKDHELTRQGQAWLDSLVEKRASLGTKIERKGK